MIFNQIPKFKSLFLLAIIAISIISVVFFLYRYESVTVNFFPQNSNLIFRGNFINATSLSDLGNATHSLGLTNMSNNKSNALETTHTNNMNNKNPHIDDLISLSNPVDTLTRMIISVVENSTKGATNTGNNIELKDYYHLQGSWNLVIRGNEFSNFTGAISLNNTLNNITKNYVINLVVSNENNITYQESNHILKIRGTGDLKIDDDISRVQLLIILYKNENIYVVFASKTNENLFDTFLINGRILEREVEY